MLFDGTLAAIMLALQHMQVGNVPAKGQAISKAISIISGGLRASLDKTKGGDIAGNLDALYGYMCNRLVLANLNNQPALLEEVHRLLMELKQAWETIGEAGKGPAMEEPSPAPQKVDPLEPHTIRLVKA